MHRAAALDRAIVLIAGRVGDTRSMDARDLTRNGLTADAPVLFATDLGDEESCRLNAAHDQRQLVRYTWHPGQGRGSLSPVQCAPAPPAP